MSVLRIAGATGMLILMVTAFVLAFARDGQEGTLWLLVSLVAAIHVRMTTTTQGRW